MPKAFDEKEREAIKERLVKEGRVLFERYGLKKTNVAEISDASGIAKGSFYNFYSSKEELFIDVMDAFEAEFQTELIARISRQNLGRKEMLKELLSLMFTMQRENAIMAYAMNEEQMSEIFSKIPDEKMQRFIDRDVNLVQQLTGLLGDGFEKYPPEVLSGLFRALFSLNLQKRMIGTEVFEEVSALMIEWVADGLIQEEA